MNKEFVVKWVEALRSGKYPQTKGSLKLDNGYCCLGVACEISGLGEWVKEQGRSFMRYHYVCDDGSSSLTSLPGPVVEECGISDDLEYRLSYMNDGGATFNEIADVIEAQIGT